MACDMKSATPVGDGFSYGAVIKDVYPSILSHVTRLAIAFFFLR